MDVVRVVDLGEVVQRPRLLREGQNVAAALVVDLDEALFDVDVGRPVLAHRAELDQMAIGRVIPKEEEEVERADHVRELRLDGLLSTGHREGRRRLFAVVDRSLRLALNNDLLEEGWVLDRADIRTDLIARDLLPGCDPLVERPDRRQRIGSVPLVPVSAGEVVDDRDLVPTGREPHRGRPAEIAVAPEDQDAHGERGRVPPNGAHRRAHRRI